MHPLALDSVVGVYVEDSVMHVGDANDTAAMVDKDNQVTVADGGFWRC